MGGTRTGLKCLHAHYANHLAGGEDVVGTWVAERIEPVHDERPGRLAAVDQGTNSVRLLILGDTGETLERHMQITRLGQGVDVTGALHPDAIARTVTVLQTFGALLARHRVTRVRVAATSAARDATNSGV